MHRYEIVHRLTQMPIDRLLNLRLSWKFVPGNKVFVLLQKHFANVCLLTTLQLKYCHSPKNTLTNHIEIAIIEK